MGLRLIYVCAVGRPSVVFSGRQLPTSEQKHCQSVNSSLLATVVVKFYQIYHQCSVITHVAYISLPLPCSTNDLKHIIL